MAIRGAGSNAWTEVQDIGPAPRWGHGMAFPRDSSRIVLVGGSSVFGPAQDTSLQAGVMRDTWEHPEAADDTGGGGGGTGVEVKSVSVQPNLIGPGAPVAQVAVTLTGPAPTGGAVNLVVSVGEDTSSPRDLSNFSRWFLIPSSLTVPAGESSVSFQMSYKGACPH
jgi:hypothetical protein